jgi:peptidoglycan/LPS O-acetylase OafA/YrhL
MHSATSRLVCLDFLRAVAVLLVIFRHFEFEPSANVVCRVIQRGGWIGVDLFFVLSGFLVSGLLFREYARDRNICISRFLIRRGLKIYPAFYFFLAATLLFMAWRRTLPDFSRVLAEILFVQNYFPHFWDHTWSLAVEEHFYVGIVLLIALLLQLKGGRPLRALPYILLAVALGAACLRIAKTGADYPKIVYPTHLRIDSLGFGVLLSFFWNFDREGIQPFFRRFRVPCAALGLLLLAPAFIWEIETPAVHTLGLTGFYLGSGMLLMAMLVSRFPDNLAFRSIARAGTYSYSIYLWHLPVLRWATPATLSRAGITGSSAGLATAILESLLVGIVVALLIEVPGLIMRDRFFPSKS